MNVMTKEETLAYIESLQALGSSPGLDSITELCARLGNPQDKLEIIHIAGTNGKGSVSAYLAGALKANGFKVGRYNSPTIKTYRERICIGNQMISFPDLCKYFSLLREVCDEMVKDGFSHPTSFEIETALGFLYFLEKQVDFVILEVGMGGKLDATNLIQKPKLCVIVSVSMDHMHFLGDSLEEIAAQKAGIIKKGCPVVTLKQDERVMRVIQKRCQEMEAPLTIADMEDASRIDRIHLGLKKQSFRYEKKNVVNVPLLGVHQIENAYLAVTALSVLKELGLTLNDNHILKGIMETKWPCRFEVVSQKPLFVLDGAHNEDASKRLAESVRFYFTNKKIIYIMGILKDKEYEKIIENTYEFADSIITVKTPNNERAMDAYELAKVVSNFHKKVTCADSLEEAVEMSYLLADKDSVILAFGSLSYLGQLSDIINKRNQKKNGR